MQLTFSVFAPTVRWSLQGDLQAQRRKRTQHRRASAPRNAATTPNDLPHAVPVCSEAVSDLGDSSHGNVVCPAKSLQHQ